MLIFVTTPLFPNIYNKQHGIYIYEQCKALGKMGNKVVVLNISSVRWNRWLDKTCREIDIIHEEIMDIYTLNLRGLLSSKIPRYTTFSAWYNLKKLYRFAIKKHGIPDVFYAHFTFPAGYATNKLSKVTNIPFVVMEHYSLFLKSNLHNYIRKILINTLDNASKFICVSNNLKLVIERLTLTKKSISVIPNLVDERFKFYNFIKRDEKFRYFSAGNLIDSKRFDLLIKAFCLAFDDEDNVSLSIAGDGKEYEKLLNIINKNSRQGQIKLLGRLNREEILRQYIECNCFVLPSKYETFGIAYREAMAVGRPIISTRNGGVEEEWNDKYGILIPVDDQLSLKNALINMHEKFNSYDLKYISSECIKKYSSDSIGTNISKVLCNIVGG